MRDEMRERERDASKQSKQAKQSQASTAQGHQTTPYKTQFGNKSLFWGEAISDEYLESTDQYIVVYNTTKQ